MKKVLLILLIFTNFSCKEARPTKKIDIEINSNIELLGLAYFISFESDGLETDTIKFLDRNVLKKDWHNYGYRQFKQFGSFAFSSNLAKSFEVADHLWLDYLYNLLLQVELFPNARITNDIDLAYYKDFSQSGDKTEARVKAEIFLDGFNKFFEEIDFKNYIKENSAFYEKAVEEVKMGAPDHSFIELNENFYKKEFNRYVLIPSLTTPKGMGFGLRHTKQGKVNVFNVFGAFDYQSIDDSSSLEMGFDNRERLNELSAHEFGHSFVNPVIDEVPTELISRTEKLFESIKLSMSDQGYNTWKVCLYEHFVRAGEIYIWNKLGKIETSNRLKQEYINNRNFIFIPKILVELENYDKGEHSSYLETVKKSLEKLLED
jgi:hypothetical protein